MERLSSSARSLIRSLLTSPLPLRSLPSDSRRLGVTIRPPHSCAAAFLRPALSVWINLSTHLMDSQVSRLATRSLFQGRNIGPRFPLIVSLSSWLSSGTGGGRCSAGSGNDARPAEFPLDIYAFALSPFSWTTCTTCWSFFFAESVFLFGTRFPQQGHQLRRRPTRLPSSLQ